MKDLIKNVNSDVLSVIEEFHLSPELVERAQENLGKNTNEVELNRQQYKVIRPGKLYPGVWGWDAAFHAIGLAHQSGQRSLEELEVSSLGQTEDGRIPSILFYDPKEAEETYYPAPNVWQCKSKIGLNISGISQPPVFAFALERILEIDPSCKKDEDKIHQLFDVAYRYQQWWYEQRDPAGNGLVVSVHPWETGRDNAVDWDSALKAVQKIESYKEMRFDSSLRKDIQGLVDPLHRPINEDYKMFIYLLEDLRNTEYSIKNDDGAYKKDIPFCVQDIGIISFLQASNESLIKLCDQYGTSEQKNQLKEWSILTTENARIHLWNEKDNSFQSRDYNTGKLTNTTNGSFLVLSTQIPTKEQVSSMMEVLNCWRKGGESKIEYNIPSVAPDHSKFEQKRYWRGPVWTIINYVAVFGFLKQAKRFENLKFYSKGLQLMVKTLELIQQDKGFYEYHDSITGEGCGGKNFGFTSVAFLELFSKLKKIQKTLIKK